MRHKMAGPPSAGTWNPKGTWYLSDPCFLWTNLFVDSTLSICSVFTIWFSPQFRGRRIGQSLNRQIIRAQYVNHSLSSKRRCSESKQSKRARNKTTLKFRHKNSCTNSQPVTERKDSKREHLAPNQRSCRHQTVGIPPHSLFIAKENVESIGEIRCVVLNGHEDRLSEIYDRIASVQCIGELSRWIRKSRSFHDSLIREDAG